MIEQEPNINDILKGPWKLVENGDANSYSVYTEDGKWVLALLYNGEVHTPTQIKVMEHLVASMNACVDIPTEDLQRWGVSLIEKMREDELFNNLKQRDGLLTAAKNMLKAFEYAGTRLVGAEYEAKEALKAMVDNIEMRD